MAEKVGLLIDVDSSQAVKGLRDTSAALDKMRQSGSQLANGLNPAAARMDALAAAQSKARGSASELAASQRELVGAARDAAGGVGALNQNLANLKSAKEHVRGLTSEVDALAGSFAKAGTAGAAVMAYSVGQATSLSRAMGLVSARTRASADEMGKLKANALALGNDNRFSALSAADVGRGQAALGTGGLTPAQIVGGASESTAAAAIVGGTDMVEAAELVVDAMKTFRMEAGETMSVVDALAGASSGSATDFGQLSAALKQGGAAAADLKRPMTETIGTLALLADHMIRGSDAGTSYKTFMLALTPTSDAAAEAMERYKLKLADGSGNFKSMAAIAEELKTKLGGLSEANRTAALKQIFGNDAYRIASALLQEGAAGVEHYTAMVSRSGAAVESATRMQEGLHGALDALQSTAETAATVFGSELAPAVEASAKAAEGLLNGLGPTERKTFAFGTAGLFAAAGLLKASTMALDYKVKLSLLRGTTDSTATAIGGLSSKVLRGVGIVSAAIAGYETLRRMLKAYSDTTLESTSVLEQFAGGMSNVVATMLDWAKNPVWNTLQGLLRMLQWEARQAMEWTGMAASVSGSASGAGGGMTSAASSTASGIGGAINAGMQAAADAVAKEVAKAGPADSAGSGGGGGDGKSGGGSAAAKKQKTAAELQAEADEKLLKAKQEQLAAVDAQLRIIKAGGAAAAEQTNKTQAAARIAGDAVESGRVFNKKQLQCAEAVSTIYKEAGVLSQVYTVTTQASKAMLEHPDRFQRLSPGAALRPGDYVAKPYKSGVGAFSGDAGWHAMMVTDQGKVAGAPNAGSTFQNQGSQSKLPSGWVGFRPKSGAAGGDTAGLEAQKKRLEDDIAGLQGGAASLQLQAERAESAAKAQQEASEAAKQAADEAKKAAEEQRQAQIDKIQREGAGKMVRAEAGIWQAEQGRSLAGQGQQSQAFQEVIAAHEAFWAAREETARALAAITGDTTELERTQLETERERSQLLDDEIAKQRAIREEKRRQREEAEKQAKEARLQKSGDAATLADIMAERAKIQGASAQTQAALEKKQQGLQLRHAAELARQGQVVEAERIRNEVLREQMEGSKAGKDALKEAVIGGDMGRISDILQQARRTGGPSAGSGQGDDDPVAYAIRNGRSQQPRIIAGAVDERLRREALETARLIEDS